MEPRSFTEGERKSLEFLFDTITIYDNYAHLHWRGQLYVITPIGDSAEYACTSPVALFTAFSFSAIKEFLGGVTRDVVSE